MKRPRLAWALLACLSVVVVPAIAQTLNANSGTIRGTVHDPTGAVIPGATVNILNPVSGYSRSTQTDAKGNFDFENVPYNPYHTTIQAKGFKPGVQDVNVNSPVPQGLNITLQVGESSQSVTVASGNDLIETSPVAHTDIDRNLFTKLPLESNSSALSSLVTLATPGISADSNGLFHGFGDHASNSFSLDGQPITDQQSKVFSNQVPVNAVQSLEVIQGAPPAEYGDKTSTVIVVTTRSGLGVTQPHGQVTMGYGTYGTVTPEFDLSYGGQNWGNYLSVDGLNTGRFLDGPELQVFHDHGNEENFFDRVDFKSSTANSFNADLGFTRSWFQTPNSYDAQNATGWNGLTVNNGGVGPNGVVVGPQDQRSQIRSFNIAPTWTHLINANSVFTTGLWVRQDQFNYYPSNDPFADLTPDLQLQTVGQSRRLTNLGLRMSYSYVNGHNNLLIGGDFEHWLLNENDTFGLVDPTLNAVCLNADGSPDTDPSVTNPTQCTGTLSPNPNFVPLLGCYDLTRTAPLPGSDGCPNTTSTNYNYLGRGDIREEALYAEDTLTAGNFTFNLGMRGDFYNGFSAANAAEPRLGGSYNIKRTNTVLRASYARSMQTPFNENLVLASEGCNNTVVNDIMGTTGTPCVGNEPPLAPGIRNSFHVGLDQAFGSHLVFNGEYIWDYTTNAFDFSVFGNTPITFPVEWEKSKIPGFAASLKLLNYHHINAYTDFSHIEARFYTPQITGIGATPNLGAGQVFRIDHDENFNQTTHVQWQPWNNGPWFGVNWRYDSGLVAGAVPCAGGNCANGPNGTDTVVDVSQLTPDMQFEAGLYCGTTFATPTTPISANDLCPASQYGSNLLHIPAAGTEDDDHNPPRIAPRNLFDLAVGDDNLMRSASERTVSAQFQVVNLTNKVALYNFLSTFSGTHYVSPRAMSFTLGYHF